MAEYDLTNYVIIDHDWIATAYAIARLDTSKPADRSAGRRAMALLVRANILERGPWITDKPTFKIRSCFLLSPEQWKRKHEEIQRALERLEMASPIV